MKNVLFIGPYRQTDGWGHMAKEYVNMLMKCDCNLAIRPVYMSSSVDRNPNTLYNALEAVSFPYYDLIIQNVLPHMVEYYPNSKNVAIVDIETSNLKHTAWPRYLNLLDETWVDTHVEYNTLKNDGVKNVKQIKTPFNPDKFTEVDTASFTELKDTFNFYFVGEYTERKNVQALLIAFAREFKRGEDVRLVIKTGIGGISPQQSLKRISEELSQLKTTLRIYHRDKYISEYILTDRLPEKDLWGLHSTCNAFVMPSRGESSCLPMMDAMFFGNFPIYTKNTGMDTTASYVGMSVPSRNVPVVCKNPPIQNLYTSREYWQDIDIECLQKAMRLAIKDNRKSESRIKARIEENYYQNLKGFWNELIG